MQAQSLKLKFLLGSQELLTRLSERSALTIFSEIVLDFWSQVSSAILSDRTVKQYPDVVTLGFYCRKANLNSLQKRYAERAFRLGRGVIFHIAPSNVPVNFAYSLLAGMLAGNANIVRVSSKDFIQVDLICKAMVCVLSQPAFDELRDRLCVVRYDRDQEINALLSSVADVRVIWGGDASIKEIRKAPLPARAYDITFADRYSLALLNADSVLALSELELGTLARAFYNDTYLFDQNACSAPRLVVWTGATDRVLQAKKQFWTTVQSLLADYSMDGVLAIEKLSTFCIHAGDSIGVHQVSTTTNKLWRVEVDRLDQQVDAHRCAAGYFLEYTAKQLNEIGLAVNRKYQTLAYFGYTPQEMLRFMQDARLTGIDRVVPIGKTTDFDLVWDGHDLIRAMSRECSIA